MVNSGFFFLFNLSQSKTLGVFLRSDVIGIQFDCWITSANEIIAMTGRFESLDLIDVIFRY